MATMLKINGRNCREMAHDAAKAAGKSCHFNMVNYSLNFDLDDAVELELTLADSAKYWLRMGKRAKAIAAETVRDAVVEVIMTERARLSWTK